MFVSPGARLKYWKPNIYKQERFLFDSAALLAAPGDVVWDVGANVGVFSVAASAIVGLSGRVMAFEADSWLVNLLHRTTQSLGASYAPVDVINAAVADGLGFAEFAIAARSRATNYLVKTGGSTQSGGVRETYRVLTVGLDDMLRIAPAPKVIKMDIEGAEALAFSTANRMINTVRPRILCEVLEKNYDEYVAIFDAVEYVHFDAENHYCPVISRTISTGYDQCLARMRRFRPEVPVKAVFFQTA